MEYRINGLPGPDNLAKKSRLGTTQVSLRIKDKTYDVFSRYAEQYESTPGAMINELLNQYAEQVYNKEREDSLNQKDLNKYMLDALKKLAVMNNEQLFLVSNKRMEFENDVLQANEIFKTINARINSSNPEDAPYLLLRFENIHRMFTSGTKKAHWEVNGRSGSIYIPSKFWFFVGAVLALYARQYREHSVIFDDTTTPTLDDHFLDKLIEIVNKSDLNSDLAKNMAELFSLD